MRPLALALVAALAACSSPPPSRLPYPNGITNAPCSFAVELGDRRFAADGQVCVVDTTDARQKVHVFWIDTTTVSVTAWSLWLTFAPNGSSGEVAFTDWDAGAHLELEGEIAVTAPPGVRVEAMAGGWAVRAEVAIGEGAAGPTT